MAQPFWGQKALHFNLVFHAFDLFSPFFHIPLVTHIVRVELKVPNSYPSSIGV